MAVKKLSGCGGRAGIGTEPSVARRAQAELSSFLRGCRIENVEERLARAAGVACGRAGTADVVDAYVVVGALERDDIVLTSDPGDLKRSARAFGKRLDTYRV